MEHTFWHQLWESNDIKFHEKAGNALLRTYFEKLPMPETGRVFVPLCGKTQDIPWLLSKGYDVVGAELNELAVSQLFADLGVAPEITSIGTLKCFSAPGLDIFAGNIFEITPDQLGPVDAIFDRAALVALPEDMRIKYTRHLTSLSGSAPQLLITFDYDQALMPGPPFYLNDAEIRRHYGNLYDITLLASEDISGGLKGQAPAKEVIRLLIARA